MLIRIVTSRCFWMSEEEIMRIFGETGVCVFYAFDNYDYSVAHILKLREEVMKEYPDMKDSEMGIREFTRNETKRFVSHTVLAVTIPAEDYLKLRKEHEIKSL